MSRPRVREKLLDSAYCILRERGVACLTTREIAACAGTTEASVFNNFGDKAGLLHSMVNERLPEIQDVRRCVESEVSRESFALWLEQLFDAAQTFYHCILPLSPEMEGKHTRKQSGHSGYLLYDALVTRLQCLRDDGVIASDADCDALATMILGSAIHNAMSELNTGEKAEGETERAILRSLLLLFQ